MVSPSASRQFDGFESIFAISNPLAPKEFVAELRLPLDEALALMRAEKVPSHVIVARYAGGKNPPGDVVWTTFPSPLLLNRRVVQVLRDNGFTGFDVSPVELTVKNSDVIREFDFLRVFGRCGAIDDRLSPTVEKVYPAGIFPVLKGMYFDPESWDGSDIFMPTGPTGFVLVTEKVKRALTKAKVRNIQLRGLDQFERIPQSNAARPSIH